VLLHHERAEPSSGRNSARYLLAEWLGGRVWIALFAVAPEVWHGGQGECYDPCPFLGKGEGMAARAISSGTVSFGLVSIPIKVYSATRSKSVSFNMLHETDKARLKQQYICSTCGEVVERSATVRGYEFSRGQYVVLSEDELKALQKKSDQTIEIEEFVPIEQVDPIYFEKSYLLGPDKGGHKAYRLLRKAMMEAGKVAVGRFSTRGREQLVLLRPVGSGLTLHGLFYADEVRGFDDVDLGDEIDLKEGELALAKQLIEQLSNRSFDAEKYGDEYRHSVLEAIDRKVAGEEVVAMPATEQREKIIDLVAALKQSLAEKRAAAEPPKRERKAAKAKGKTVSKGKSASS
jgi:DNA end-binding protein Ku